jgi:D-alanyl-D-alanine carboxypeptidase (penicillin-binding protein 5/6)
MYSKRALKPPAAMFAVGIISLLFSLPAVTGPSPPILDCPSYLLVDADTGDIICGKNIHEIRAPASTTKMMTALLALELGDPNDLVTFSYRADAEPGASLGVNEGEQIPLADLTCAMLVKSGNDAAVAIAEHIGGSVEGFCDLMNARAEQLGMRDTFFANPNGMPDDRHHSTAFDLSLLAREAMTHPEIREWTSMTEVRFDQFGDREDVTFESTNHLLDLFPLCNGIKTGFTNAAGFCLVGSATWRDKTLIGIVLGCGRNEQWPQAIELFDYGFSLYDSEYEAFRELYDRNAVF